MTETQLSVVKIPFKVEKDQSKTYFLPDCRESGGYRVGPKGKTQAFLNYWDALAAVMSFPQPEFRRPSKYGAKKHGRVVCEAGDVEEWKRAELEALNDK